MSEDQATEPFVRALGRLLRDTNHAAVDEDGSINWATLARQIPGMHYETLRKVKSGDRTLDAAAIEQIAAAVPVDPSYFAEYRLLKAREAFDPRAVGLEQALANLKAYNQEADSARPKRRRGVSGQTAEA